MDFKLWDKTTFRPADALLGNTLHGFILTCENHPPIPAIYYFTILKSAG